MLRPTISELARDLAEGRTTSRALVEEALVRIAEPTGEGARSHIRVFADAARAEADASDARRRRGDQARALEGLPVSVKDLCDVAGQVTLAGSIVRASELPAAHDAVVVQRLRAAGAVIIGTTNMNEFAMGTTGTNAHYGTPRNPWDRSTGRIPGGSSSGAAVAVADGMCVAAVGSDTAGSIRVPAAMCGLTGFKPTARRVPLVGVFPLSPSLDSVGPIARTVACCARMDAVLSGEESLALQARPLAGARFGSLTTLASDDVEPLVAAVYQRALARLRAAGASVVDVAIRAVADLPALFKNGGISMAEAYRFHQALLDRAESGYDPIVALRLRAGAAISPADYAELQRARADAIAAAASGTRDFDAVLMPTCPMTAPPIALVQDLEVWQAVHRRLLYPNAIANFLDRCALTLPLQPPGEPPVGMTIMGEHMADRKVLALGIAIEATLA
ncbi:MAG: amidase [Gemmatimonadaceae bacterium]